MLLAAFVNLLAVAVVAPLLGLALRRRRPDLPRFIASDYAGTWLLLAITAAFVVGGLAHRAEAQAESARENAVARAMHDYVVSFRALEYAAGLNSTSTPSSSSPTATARASPGRTNATHCACTSRPTSNPRA